MEERIQVSVGSGNKPVWDADGKTLYFWSGNEMMSVRVHIEPRLAVDRPTMLFAGKYIEEFDVSEDGQRFVMIRQRAGSTQDEITIVLNWFEEIKRLDPTGK